MVVDNETVELTLEEAVENHRKLWYEIARMVKEDIQIPEKVSGCSACYLKDKALKKVFPGINVLFGDCFLCDFDSNYLERSCAHCPLVKRDFDSKDDSSFRCLDGLYDKFENTLRHKKSDAVDIAIQIAELPIINR